MGSVAERVGRNEAIFREVNERIAEVSARLPHNGELELELVCECSDASCATSLRASSSAYEHVRRHPRHFIVLPTHRWNSDVEREVLRTAAYTVIEKVEEAGEVAAEADPRG